MIALECSRIADARRCPPWSETAEPYGSSMKSSRRYLAVVALLMTVTTAHTSQIAGKTLVAKVDAYLAPYVEGRNFSGAILIAEGGCVLFTKGVTAWRITNWQCRTDLTRGSTSHQFPKASLPRRFSCCRSAANFTCRTRWRNSSQIIPKATKSRCTTSSHTPPVSRMSTISRPIQKNLCSA